MLTVTSQHRGRARKPRTNDAINLKAEIRSVVVLWWRHAVMRWNERLHKMGHGSDSAMLSPITRNSNSPMQGVARRQFRSIRGGEAFFQLGAILICILFSRCIMSIGHQCSLLFLDYAVNRVQPVLIRIFLEPHIDWKDILRNCITP